MDKHYLEINEMEQQKRSTPNTSKKKDRVLRIVPETDQCVQTKVSSDKKTRGLRKIVPKNNEFSDIDTVTTSSEDAKLQNIQKGQVSDPDQSLATGSSPLLQSMKDHLLNVIENMGEGSENQNTARDADISGLEETSTFSAISSLMEVAVGDNEVRLAQMNMAQIKQGRKDEDKRKCDRERQVTEDDHKEYEECTCEHEDFSHRASPKEDIKNISTCTCNLVPVVIPCPAVQKCHCHCMNSMMPTPCVQMAASTSKQVQPSIRQIPPSKQFTPCIQNHLLHTQQHSLRMQPSSHVQKPQDIAGTTEPQSKPKLIWYQKKRYQKNLRRLFAPCRKKKKTTSGTQSDQQPMGSSSRIVEGIPKVHHHGASQETTMDLPPERADIYYFDHGNSGYYRTTDRPPLTMVDIYIESSDDYANHFWADIFGTLHLFFTFITHFILQLLRFLLYSILRPLTVGIIQIFSDYFIKPLLSILFNGVIQPILILLYNIATSFRDFCEPIAQAIGYFLREAAIVFRAIRLVEVYNIKEEQCK
ncbi:uncharacterized protein [Periplaneta americana]|uniref:uncharacterized protein isoform X2 n=1 Tax=Periplaneta americana TaxID=6978 RepID=UPI0037E7727D